METVHVSLEDLAGAESHAALARARAAAPVAWVEGLDGWLVLGRAECLEVMRDAERFTVDDPRFTTARVVGASMLSTDGAEHARHRGAWARALRRDAVLERFRGWVAAEADRLLDELEPLGGAELRTAWAGPIAAATTMHFLELDAVGVERVLGWYSDIVAAVTHLTKEGQTPCRAHTGSKSAAALAEVTSDLPAPGLTPDEVAANAAVILFGGVETMEGTITSCLWHLLTHPDQLAVVRADPSLVPAAIEESLRLEPAAASVDRYATRDTALGGVQVRAGDLVSVSLSAANRDPSVFAAPDEFDIGREDVRRHVTFAAGPHVCVGMHLARLEGAEAIARLLARFPKLTLDRVGSAPPSGLVFRKPPALHARFS